jgi:hypothetical protein
LLLYNKFVIVPIRYSLVLHPAALADLDALWDEDPRSAALLTATLEQIKVDARLLESLTIRDFGAHGSELFHVDQWIEQQRDGRNLWRLKHWELEGEGRRYRVVYALDPRSSRYTVLGIFTRDFDYDRSDPRTRRVVADYDALGIPAYR